MEKYDEDGWHGIPAMPHTRRDVGGGLRETENLEGTKFSGSPSEEGGVPGMRG